WGQLYTWNDNAGAFSITQNSNPGPTAFVVSASLPNNTYSPGAQGTVTTQVAATKNIDNVVVDTEIYDANGAKVGQNIVPANLLANQLFSSDWNLILPQSNGIYTIKVGVFSGDWSSTYFWKNNAFQFTIGTPLGGPQPDQTYPINVMVPSNGATVSGTVEIKAVIDNLAINTYTISWRVGNGSFVNLDTDPVTQSYKHAWIDFSNWNWSADHTYQLQFQATDSAGDVIGNQTVTVIH
ncbi:MAG TPA: hypothetical protein VFK07_01825, partial [Candidatus Paceibacterota bacterium]|nr:hypothetical protein [Candidatus Paceibacterota bacterium]